MTRVTQKRYCLSPVQTDATLLANNSQPCWMLHVASVCNPLLHVVGCCCQSLKPVKLFNQQLPKFLLFRDRRSVAQQCWICLQSSSNIVGAAHAHYAWFTKTYGLYPSHDTLQVPTLLGVVASVCTPLPTLLAQQCWELLRPFARNLKLPKNTLNPYIASTTRVKKVEGEAGECHQSYTTLLSLAQPFIKMKPQDN